MALPPTIRPVILRETDRYCCDGYHGNGFSGPRQHASNIAKLPELLRKA